jgi:hypothetical protein
VWYLTVVSVTLQMALTLGLLRREFSVRLNFDVAGRRPALPEPLPSP